MKTADPNTTPTSMERAADILRFDRRTVRAAIRAAADLDHFEPVATSPQGHPLFTLADYCEAVEAHQVRQAPPDLRRWCQRMAEDEARALALPCPRCGGKHKERAILPQPGRAYPAELLRWFEQNDFPTRYPEAGRDHEI